MKKLIKFISITLMLSLVVAAAGCSKGELKEKGKLSVATNAAFQPFEYIDNNQIVGIDVEIGKELAKDLSATLTIQNMNFDSVIPAVTTGKADIGLAGLSKKPDREKSVDFSDPYYDASQVIIVEKSNTSVTGQDSLKGKKVAVQKGTTGDDTAVDIVGDSNVVRFNAATDAITELKNGKVAAVIIDSFPAKIFVKQNPGLNIVGKPLTSEKYCVAVRKGNTKLLQSINKTIARLKSSGTIDQIIKKYS